MKFIFDQTKYTDMGLIVKQNKNNDIVLFWDENVEAANYIIHVFRTNYHECNNGFMQEVDIKTEVIKYREKDGNYPWCNKEANSYSIIKSCGEYDGPYIHNNKFCYQTTIQGSSYTLNEVNYVSLEKIKFITTFETSRNDLYQIISFLPNGNYIFCLEAENREGHIIQSSVPYYISIEKK